VTQGTKKKPGKKWIPPWRTLDESPLTFKRPASSRLRYRSSMGGLGG
jgi:hypothetical protein